MATALRPIAHEDRLSLVEHLDELRTRLIVCLATFVLAFSGCYVAHSSLLGLLNNPLENTTTHVGGGGGRLSQIAHAQVELAQGLDQASAAAQALASSPALSAPADRRSAESLAAGLRDAARALPRALPKKKPVTLGVAEPFTTTLTITAWFALLLSLPMILFQLYSFVLPAFSPGERRVALPLMLMIPVLFVAGVVFAYFLVLPAAVGFLQNYDTSSFDVLLQARDYYRFEILTMLALGFVFQVPVAMLAANRVGLVTASKLRRGWRYAIVVCFVIAAALPGVDPVTTILEALPLIALYALSIVLLHVYDRSPPDVERDDELAAGAHDAPWDPDRVD